MIDINNFDLIQIGLASSRQIRDWSHGEVTKPETINYRTLKPERDGLFCERIFGPTRDWECYCGKYKRVRYKGIVCERCGVEVTRAKVRRERMGHIELAAPVSHIWFFKGVPSRIGYLLDLAPKELEKVLYFAASIITSVDAEKRAADLPQIKERINTEVERINADRDEILGMIEDRSKRREAFLAEGATKGFDEDDTLWRESLESEAEDNALPSLKEVRKIADGLFADIVTRVTGSEDRRALLSIVKDAKFRPDRRLTKDETNAVSAWCQWLIKSMSDATEASQKRRIKYLRSPKGAMTGFTEDDRAWLEGAEKQVINEWPLEKARTFAAHIVADVVENAPGPEPKKVRDTITEYALRTGGAISKEDNDMLVQWATRVRDTFQELETRRSDVSDNAQDEADRLTRAWETFQDLEPRQIISDEPLFRELHDRFATPEPYGFGNYFRGGMGAEAIRDLLAQVDPTAEVEKLRDEIRTSKGQKQQKAIKRLKVVNSFVKSENKPEWMILDVIPVIPPELRPMVQLDGGRFATSDLNDLYRRVINRNNRLKRLLDLGAPEIIVNNEKRMLQEAVDALFDNGRRGRAVTGPGNRALKSLSDMLKGKQGRFRGNLLGKRVDYSGRSVIVAGPSLNLHQCGLPKIMALELFKPFIMARLVERKSVQNIKAAKKMVESEVPEVWDVLEEVISEHPVLLNRAPTLHRLGIQAFEPVLVEGKAIQVHPLVCHAYNADFDGDQMAVHLPLSAEAQAEARLLMLATHNILSPAHGEPLATPSQDMVLGLYYLTYHPDDLRSKELKDFGTDEMPPRFASAAEVIHAYNAGDVGLQDLVYVRFDKYREDKHEPIRVITTVGRTIFNDAIDRALNENLEVFDSADHPFLNETLDKKRSSRYIIELIDQYGPETVAMVLDTIKNLGFTYATRSGVTISKDDIIIPTAKAGILDSYEDKVALIAQQYDRGLITEAERKENVVDLWTQATEDVAQAMVDEIDDQNPVYMMVNSGARGSFKNISQLAGMRGLMSNPKGEIIDQPIRSNFMEGLSVLEFFISTHGARKGLADTALRTADSGYLTRRLVDVAQDVIVRDQDCGTDAFVETPVMDSTGALNRHALGRVLTEDVKKGSKTIAEAGEELTETLAAAIIDAKGEDVQAKLRSILYCDSPRGVCRTCYGRSMATGKMAELGDVVGHIAAQSIGEPGTQLTMRTFHTGGVAGADITHGLPRVVEIFEARNPKGAAELFDPGESEEDMEPYVDGGMVELEELDRGTRIVVQPQKKQGKDFEPWEVIVPRGRRIMVAQGEVVMPGHALTEGSLNPGDLLRLRGGYDTARYLISEVQKVYRAQGVEIHDKHIELIVRQMLKKVRVLKSGESDWLPGELVERQRVDQFNKSLGRRKTGHIEFEEIILGITKASLATDSFFSAASFQETTKVITDAALEGKVDDLVGLKENVIIGKLIPAGTGLPRYQRLDFGPSERPRSFYEAEEFLSGLDLGEDIELALGADD